MKAALKLALGLLLLGLLAHWAGPKRVLEGIAAVGWRAYLVAAGLMLLGQSVCSVRWFVVGRAAGIDAPFWKYPPLYLSGMFLNLFVPTSVGGDVGKAVLLAGKEEWRRGIVSVLGDRLTGLAILALVLLAGLLRGGRFLPPPVARALLVFPPAVLLALAALAVVAGRVRLPRWPRADEALQHAASVARDGRVILEALALSAVFYALYLAVHVVVGNALGIGLSLADYAVVATVTAVASMIPVSPGGLGVREGSYQLLLALAGVDRPTGLAFGVALLGVNLLLALVGGLLLYLLSLRTFGWLRG